MKTLIAKAEFKLCDKRQTTASPTIKFALYEEDHPTDVEVELLSCLGANGSTHYPSFHDTREPCGIARPSSDFLYVWHPEKIEEAIFCVHVEERALSGSEVEGERGPIGQMPDDVSDSASQLFYTGRTPSPPEQSMAKFRLSFGFKPNAPVTLGLWKPREVSVPVSDSVDSLPHQFKQMVEQLTTQDSLLTDVLLRGSHQLFMRPVLQFSDERRQYTDYRRVIRVETVEDLFPSDSTAQQCVPVLVKMKLRPFEESVSSISEAIIADVEIGYDFYRIGSIPGSSLQQRKTKQITNGLPMVRALVARIEDDGELETLELSKVDSWMVNGLVLGECYTLNEPLHEPHYILTSVYQGCRSMQELTEKVQTQRDNYWEHHTMDLPIAPTYSWRTFNREDHFPDSDEINTTIITVAVKCVNMLPKHIGGGNIILPAPKHMQFEVDSKATCRSVRKLLEMELAEDTGASADGRTSSRLFTPALQGKWRTMLWALPQIQGHSMLYKLSGCRLAHFLKPQTDEEDGRLYVEAHILPQDP